MIDILHFGDCLATFDFKFYYSQMNDIKQHIEVRTIVLEKNELKPIGPKTGLFRNLNI